MTIIDNQVGLALRHMMPIINKTPNPGNAEKLDTVLYECDDSPTSRQRLGMYGKARQVSEDERNKLQSETVIAKTSGNPIDVPINMMVDYQWAKLVEMKSQGSIHHDPVAKDVISNERNTAAFNKYNQEHPNALKKYVKAFLSEDPESILDILG